MIKGVLASTVLKHLLTKSYSKVQGDQGMENNNKKTLQDYREITNDGDIHLHLTRDQKAMILKTYDHGLNKLTGIDKMLLSAVIRQMKAAIDESS